MSWKSKMRRAQRKLKRQLRKAEREAKRAERKLRREARKLQHEAKKNYWLVTCGCGFADTYRKGCAPTHCPNCGSKVQK